MSRETDCSGVSMSSTHKNALFNETADSPSYPSNEKWQAHLLDQYKLYVEMTDRISTRRAAANSYFLSVNTAILAFAGYLAAGSSAHYLWLLAAAGITLSTLWEALIRSYSNLNRAKFVVIQQIEKCLPISPYAAEWEAMGHGLNRKLYQPVSHIERGVPIVFICLHAVVIYQAFPLGSR